MATSTVNCEALVPQEAAAAVAAAVAAATAGVCPNPGYL